MRGARNPELARVIAKRMRALREARGESQEEVGFRSGLHRTAVGQIERGEQVPSADTLVRVAGALEVDPGVLIAGIVWKPLGYVDGGFDYGEESGGVS
jgi:transcriptional regulator with XRE-family HTH domain